MQPKIIWPFLNKHENFPWNHLQHDLISVCLIIRFVHFKFRSFRIIELYLKCFEMCKIWMFTIFSKRMIFKRIFWRRKVSLTKQVNRKLAENRFFDCIWEELFVISFSSISYGFYSEKIHLKFKPWKNFQFELISFSPHCNLYLVLILFVPFSNWNILFVRYLNTSHVRCLWNSGKKYC